MVRTAQSRLIVDHDFAVAGISVRYRYRHLFPEIDQWQLKFCPIIDLPALRKVLPLNLLVHQVLPLQELRMHWGHQHQRQN